QQIPLAALAKRHEHVFVPGRAEPLVFEERTPALRLLRSLRDEAHRFANTYHRRLRRNTALQSILDEIPGVGPRRRTLLLSHFRSTDAIREASIEELASLPGMNLPAAEAVKRYLSGEGDEPGDAN
ncbi:MAG: excinuclease ABC subunit C, partial [Armatimonadetes bacterium]|nr:excinuclease ABC subunit C [Armatimonadota bacterium]